MCRLSLFLVLLCLFCGSGMEEAWLLQKADVALFFLFCAFPRCHHCFRFHLVEEASRPRIIFFFALFCFGRETVTFFCPCCLIQRSAEIVFLPPWGTLRHPNRIGRARLSCSPFFQAKSSQPPGKACCSSQKW